MQPLSTEFLDDCPQENGFRMRGSEMTRIEVFVDAAFALAVTMFMGSAFAALCLAFVMMYRYALSRAVPFSGFVLLLTGAWIPFVESRSIEESEREAGVPND